jgi:hypothetical protein
MRLRLPTSSLTSASTRRCSMPRICAVLMVGARRFLCF